MNNNILEKEDSRIFAIQEYGGGTMSICSGIQVDKNKYYCHTPSVAALYLNIAYKRYNELSLLLLNDYCINDLDKMFISNPQKFPSCPDLRLAENHTKLFDMMELYFEYIIFTYNSLEVFCNMQIGNAYNKLINASPAKSEELRKKSMKLQRDKPLKVKLETTLSDLLKSNKLDKNSLSNFNMLEDIRHNLIHLKPGYFLSGGQSKFIDDFIENILHQKNYTIIVSEIMKFYCKDGIPRWLRLFPYVK